MTKDPRIPQIAVLGGLLAWGQWGLDFALDPAVSLAIFAAAFATQALGARFVRHEPFDPRSPLISALSLCLLLRTASPLLAAAVAFLAIGSKFVLQRGGKHWFNPTNFALVAALLCFDGVWVSSGQWGTTVWLVFAIGCAGPLVLRRAARSDVTWAFLACYSGTLIARALWLGDPVAIPLHTLGSGALLIFAFFMISDPRSTPDSRAGRLAFAACVSATGLWLQLGWYEPNGLLYALALCAPLVPIFDHVLPAARFAWTAPRGENHVSAPAPPGRRPAGRPDRLAPARAG